MNNQIIILVLLAFGVGLAAGGLTATLAVTYVIQQACANPKIHSLKELRATIVRNLRRAEAA